MIEWVFWLSVMVLVYTYILYPFLLFCWVKLCKKEISKINNDSIQTEWPTVVVIISAYNEANWMEAKIRNSVALQYPNNKLTWIVVTDGSTDGTHEMAMLHHQIKVLHQSQRQGKFSAMNRAVAHTDAEILVFTDANSILNIDCLARIIPHFNHQQVGAVSGEKRVLIPHHPDAMIGEGIYWKYESLIKKLESQFNTVIGMPGELFAIRKSLFPQLSANTITEDFSIAMQVIAAGSVIRYEPGAIAAEMPSVNIIAEFKRKKRIAAGSIQTLLRTLHLCNPFKYPSIAFQYISHKIFRWLLIPLLLPILLLFSIYFWYYTHSTVFLISSILQILFYGLAFIGWVAALLRIRIKWLYIPFYYCFMNLSMLLGIIMYLRGKHTVLWEKAARN